MAFAVLALVQLSHIMTYIQAYHDLLDYEDLDDWVTAGIIDTYP